MRIDANNKVGYTTPSEQRAPGAHPASAPEAEPGKDVAALGGSQTLEKAWAQTPAVRPEKVALAKARLEDPSFPSVTQIQQVASLLADHLSATDGRQPPTST